jgi:hypothetical protein
MVAGLIADGFRNYLRAADTENRRRSCWWSGQTC